MRTKIREADAERNEERLRYSSMFRKGRHTAEEKPVSRKIRKDNKCINTPCTSERILCFLHEYAGIYKRSKEMIHKFFTFS